MKHINFLIKPASSLCNLRCKYCFYADEAVNRENESMGKMTETTALTLIKEGFSSIESGGTISFAFQGGEPTVAGLHFFEFFVKTARSLCPSDVNIYFSIQTNGTLLDEKWAKLFHDEGFLVGISLDGYKDIHDINRVDAEKNGTWNRVTKAVTMLRKYKVETNALCVVTGQCAKHPQKAYQELKKLGFDYIQFIACLDPIGMDRGTAQYSLTPPVYGKFLCDLFDIWYHDWEIGQYHSIRLFDDYIHILLGDHASTCATCGTCGSYFVVEGDGSVYPCDFFVLDEWCMGKIGERTLEELKKSESSIAFLNRDKEKPLDCRECRWNHICNGGCKKDWYTVHGDMKNYYCESFRMLLDYAMPRMKYIAQAERMAQMRYRR